MKTIRKYSCMNCGGNVSKPPCVAPGDKNKKGATISYHGIGNWTCENCGHGAKVKCILETIR